MSEDRAAYRKGPGAPDKKADVGAGSAEIDFVSLLLITKAVQKIIESSTLKRSDVFAISSLILLI